MAGMVFYSVNRRGGEPVVCLFGARRLQDGTVEVDILAVADRVVDHEVLVQSPDERSRMKVKLPEEAVGRGTPIVMKQVRIEQV